MNSIDIETIKIKKNNNIYEEPYLIVVKCLGDIMYEYTNDMKKNNIIENCFIKLFKIIKEKELDSEIFYIHNLNFDGILIINELSKNNSFNIKTLIKNMSIYNINIKMIGNKDSIILRCSYKLLPISLKQIPILFKMENKKLPFPYKFLLLENMKYKGSVPPEIYWNSREDYLSFINVNNDFNFFKHSLEYCIRDVEITSDFVKIFYKIITSLNKKILTYSYTISSVSLNLFIKLYNDKGVSISTNRKYSLKLRDSYFGGRCEVYGNKKDDEFLYHFDFSGMYGQCMLEKFPLGEKEIIINPLNCEKQGFYYIKAYSDLIIPVLPHKDPITRKLMFTNGYIEGLYWFEEILLFIKHGGIVKEIEYGIIFSRYEHIFHKFIENINILKENSESHRIIGKFIVNSLYGRLGMDDDLVQSFLIHKTQISEFSRFTISKTIYVNDYVLIDVIIDRNLIDGGKIETFKKPKNNIALASSITSKARIRLYKAQMEAIESGGRLIYSDTDSIFAAYKEKKIYNEKYNFLEWDLDKKDTVILDGVFISPKQYAVRYLDKTEKIKFKGFNKINYNLDDIKHFFYNDYDKIVIKDFFEINKSNFTIISKFSEKEALIQAYDKRVFSKNKKETFSYFKKIDGSYNTQRL